MMNILKLFVYVRMPVRRPILQKVMNTTVQKAQARMHLQ